MTINNEKPVKMLSVKKQAENTTFPAYNKIVALVKKLKENREYVKYLEETIEDAKKDQIETSNEFEKTVTKIYNYNINKLQKTTEKLKALVSTL